MRASLSIIGVASTLTAVLATTTPAMGRDPDPEAQCRAKVYQQCLAVGPAGSPAHSACVVQLVYEQCDS